MSGEPQFGLPTTEYPSIGPTLWCTWADEASNDQEPLNYETVGELALRFEGGD